jgi:3-oxoacyl-[acyl-carrier protein] reductase
MSVDDNIKFADFELIQVGQEARLVRKIGHDDIARFADLTGDSNPLHVDEEFAARTSFGGTVAHGMLSASLISTVIGTMLPGAGALWLSQSLDFLHPVRPGDTVSVLTRVVRKHAGRRILELETEIRNDHGTLVIGGRSKVQLLEEKQPDPLGSKRGSVALVTGASRGIGAAIASALASQGIKVVVNYSQSADRACAVVDSITSVGGAAIAVGSDIRDPDSVKILFARVLEEFGPVDILVNNAWPPLVIRPFAGTTWSELDEQFAGGVRGAFLCCQAALPHMVDQKFGRIVNIGSVAADSTPPAQQTAYVVAKAALAAMTRCIALEYGPSGITANLVAPGMTETAFISEVSQKARLVTQMQTPTRRLAQPEDVAEVVAFLIGPAARHITGETIRVCGGATMM